MDKFNPERWKIQILVQKVKKVRQIHSSVNFCSLPLIKELTEHIQWQICQHLPKWLFIQNVI